MRLGVNIDHVATVRNARTGSHPSLVTAARIACEHGADSITVHLREDRRHIRDDDVRDLLSAGFRLNLEIAATEEMVAIGERLRPWAVCLVPEKREEQTTEGGLDLLLHGDARSSTRLKDKISRLRDCGAQVSLFIEADLAQITQAFDLGAAAVELHTGSYALEKEGREDVLNQLRRAAMATEECGLLCHAGHGLDFSNVEAIARIPAISELNIGYFLVAQALFDSLGTVVARMKELILSARANIES